MDLRTALGILRFAANSSSPSSPTVGLDVHDLQREGESEAKPMIPKQALETSLWERLGNAAALDIQSVDFPWTTLASLHHIERKPVPIRRIKKRIKLLGQLQALAAWCSLRWLSRWKLEKRRR